MRLLDLFCGAGGAAMGYHRAGFTDIVGIDIKPQPRYPFTFVQADAMTYPLDGFDAIHASPPCQAWTAYRRRSKHVRPSPDLIAPIRQMIERVGAPYVIENVEGAPLRLPVLLCGSMFDLDVRRHRLFESSVGMMFGPCAHHRQAPRFRQATNRANLRRTVEVGVWRIPEEIQRRAMGIDWMALEELSQAIPPAYTEWIGRRLIGAIRRAA